MRRVWSLSRGVVIDECEIENTADKDIYRELREPDDVRVELVLKGALAAHDKSVVEVGRPVARAGQLAVNEHLLAQATKQATTEMQPLF